MGKDVIRKTLIKLSDDSKEKISSLLPRLSPEEIEQLFVVIDRAIERENIIVQEKLSPSDLKDELGIINGHLAEALSRISYIGSNNKHADTKLDFHYWKANSNDELMLKLYRKCETNTLNQPISGYSIIIDKMMKGIVDYDQFLTPLITKGRPETFVYCSLILDIGDYLEAIGNPYKISSNKGAAFVKIIEVITKVNSRTIIKNTIRNRDSLRKYNNYFSVNYSK